MEKYLENPKEAEIADWSKYTSRMEGIELIERLTEEGGFAWETPAFWGVTETMAANNASLGALEEEIFVGIVTGAKALDEFDQFVSSWRQLGGDQITAEVQAAADGEEE